MKVYAKHKDGPWHILNGDGECRSYCGLGGMESLYWTCVSDGPGDWNCQDCRKRRRWAWLNVIQSLRRVAPGVKRQTWRGLSHYGPRR